MISFEFYLTIFEKRGIHFKLYTSIIFSSKIKAIVFSCYQILEKEKEIAVFKTNVFIKVSGRNKK